MPLFSNWPPPDFVFLLAYNSQFYDAVYSGGCFRTFPCYLSIQFYPEKRQDLPSKMVLTSYQMTRCHNVENRNLIFSAMMVSNLTSLHYFFRQTTTSMVQIIQLLVIAGQPTPLFRTVFTLCSVHRSVVYLA
jgi:hypothetical protein